MGKERVCTALLSTLCAALVLLYYSSISLPQHQWTFRRGNGTQGIAAPAPTRSYVDCGVDYGKGLAGIRCGYVIGLRYSGQQGAGVDALDSLQHWVRDMRLPMAIVEPFVQRSTLGLRRIPRTEGVRFSEMFDLENFNGVSRREGVTELIDWPTFVAHGTRRAVYVRMKGFANETDIPPPRVVWAAPAGSSECWHGQGKDKREKRREGRRHHIPIYILYNPDDETNLTICIVRSVICYFKFANRHTLSPEELHSIVLGGLDPSSVTLVFSLWRGPWSTSHSLPPQPTQQLTAAASNATTTTNTTIKLSDGPRLRSDVSNYQQKFLRGSAADPGYVAVMLRTEHSVIMLQHQQSSAGLAEVLGHCLQEVEQVTRAAMKKVGSGSLLVTADVGYYGSGTWNRTMRTATGEFPAITAQVQEAVERLYAGSWSFQEWEDSFAEATGGVKDRGYVAALQRALASQAACLVLLGGGSFQALSLTSYLHRTASQPHTRCVHLVCIDRKYVEDFSHKIKSS